MRQWDLKDVLHTRLMHREECCSDHRLVHCKLQLQFNPNPKKKGNSVKMLNVGSMFLKDVKVRFQADMQQKLIIPPCNHDHTPDTLWEDPKSAIHKTSADVLGHRKKKNREWLDEKDRDSGHANREQGSPSMSPCTTNLSPIESYYLTNLQHSTAQTQRNTEQVVELPCI